MPGAQPACRAASRSEHRPTGPRCSVDKTRWPSCSLASAGSAPGPSAPPPRLARAQAALRANRAVHPAETSDPARSRLPSCSHLPKLCANPLGKRARKARNMAADKPAKAPPLYEGGPDKSTARLDTVIAPRMARQSGLECRACMTRTRHEGCLAFAILLAACSQQPASPPTNQAAAAPLPPNRPRQPPKAFVVRRKERPDRIPLRLVGRGGRRSATGRALPQGNGQGEGGTHRRARRKTRPSAKRKASTSTATCPRPTMRPPASPRGCSA